MAGLRITDCTAQRAPGRLIRRIDRAMRARIDERLAAMGLSYVQWAALKMIGEGVIETPTDLGREVGYTSGAATRLADALEARGWIARQRDGGDRRIVRLAVTPAGGAVIDRGRPVAIGVWNELLAGFTQDEVNRFTDMLVALDDLAQRIPAATEAAA